MKENTVRNIAVVGAAAAVASLIPRVRHAVGAFMVGLNENLGIPAAREDIDNDTTDPATTDTAV